MLEPWQLITLKQKYGGIYVTNYDNSLYVQRQPTLLEIVQQHDAKRVFNLSNQDMFTELIKQIIVYPEDPSDVPQPQLDMLAEAMLDDVPMTDKELENKIYELADKEQNLFKDIALELWSQIQGSTIHEFYSQPIGEIMDMYQTIKIVEELTKKIEEEREQQQPSIQFDNQVSYNQPAKRSQQQQYDISGLLGKDLNTQLEELAKGAG